MLMTLVERRKIQVRTGNRAATPLLETFSLSFSHSKYIMLPKHISVRGERTEGKRRVCVVAGMHRAL